MQEDRGQRIIAYEDVRNKFNTVNNPYVIFQTNNSKDYVDYFMSDPTPERANLRTNYLRDNPGANWEAWKKGFIEMAAPLISFCIMDRSVTPHKRTYLAALWMNMPATPEILEFMLTANIFSNQIGVAIP
jgi:hypothetical protein